MRLGIDARSLQDFPHAGVAEYASSLLSHLSTLLSDDIAVFTKPAVPSKIFNASLALARRPFIDRRAGSPDVFWMPNLNFASISRRARLVLTVHDLSFERFPEFFSYKQRLWHTAVHPRALAKRADRIIAVSEHTKRDIENLYDIAPEKISVVYSGIDPACHPRSTDSAEVQAIKTKYNLPNRYILYVGTIEPRKNVPSVIEAFTTLKESGDFPDLHLVIAGARGWCSEHVYRLAQNSSASNDIRFIGYIRREEKPGLYNLASAFVYPSFYEGFGFPPLEAQACGVPVVCAANSAMAEVLGASAMLVNADFVNEIAAAVRILLTDTAVAAEYKKRGIENAKRFTWDRAARQTLEVFESTIA